MPSRLISYSEVSMNKFIDRSETNGHSFALGCLESIQTMKRSHQRQMIENGRLYNVKVQLANSLTKTYGWARKILSIAIAG